MIAIENDRIRVAISEKGAEVKKVYDKKKGFQFMWNGDRRYWGKVSPILFPIVGKLKDDTYTLDGKEYKLPKHGFLRDQEFTVDRKTDTMVHLMFASEGKFKDVYPYEFEVHVIYEVTDNMLDINWQIVNLEEKDMYFSIGGHPAFKVPMVEGETIKDYYLEIQPSDKPVERIEMNGETKLEENLEKVSLNPEMFEHDAIIFSNVDGIVLKSNTNSHEIRLDFKDFPYVGIWTKYMEEDKNVAPFVCIEPWYGIGDLFYTDGDLKNKVGINKIDPKDVFDCAYSIEFI